MHDAQGSAEAWKEKREGKGYTGRVGDVVVMIIITNGSDGKRTPGG